MAQTLFSQWIAFVFLCKSLFASQNTTDLENLDLGKYSLEITFCIARLTT